MATNFLLGPLRPRGASKSFLLPPLPPSLLIHSGPEASSRPSRSSLYTLSQRRPSKLWVSSPHSPAESDPQCSENQSSSPSLCHLASSSTCPPHSPFQPCWLPLCLSSCCLGAFALAVPLPPFLRCHLHVKPSLTPPTSTSCSVVHVRFSAWCPPGELVT